MLKFIEKEDYILDLGCGSCCNTKSIKDKGYNIIGVDIVNKGKCIKPQIYDGHRIPYQDKTFDVSICSYVLHHIPYYMDTIEELRRVTKKYIIIIEDTPETSFDNFFTNQHSKSDWGSGEFKTKDKWIETLKSVVHNEDISRYEFPFSAKPLIYPVPATLFVIKPD